MLLDTTDLKTKLASAIEGLLDVSLAFADDSLDQALFDPFYELVECHTMVEAAERGPDFDIPDIDLDAIIADTAPDFEALLHDMDDMDIWLDELGGD